MRIALSTLSVLVFTASSFAQAPPAPAPELQKLAPLVGSWNGSGEMREPSGATTKWTARGVYAWALDGHFVQEDFRIDFAGVPAPLVFRAYLGWDREQKRYVNAVANNGGEVDLHEFQLLPDGTHLQVMRKMQAGVPYAERTLTKIDGDTMTMVIDMLMANGPSSTVVTGTFTRADKVEPIGGHGDRWMGKQPHASLARLQRSAGAYDVQGQIVPMPGTPAMKITGTDDFRLALGCTVLHGRTEGTAEGMPGKYVGEVFWGHDAAQDCLVAVYVSSVGEVMKMDARWTDDGQLLAMAKGTLQGQPSVQRMLMQFGVDGAAASAVSHTILGTAAPFESFRATYTRRK